MSYRDKLGEFHELLVEMRRLQGGLRVSIEEVSLGRNYSEVESVLRQLDTRFEALIVRTERTGVPA